MNRSTILVVEDNPTTRKLLRVTLQMEGYPVVEAADGAAALAVAAQLRPNLILQDLMLPDTDGLELALQLRRVMDDREVPIIAVSGFLARMEDARARDVGFTGFLLKPVERVRLLEMVRAQLPAIRAVPVAALAGRRVLIVDDDPVERKLLRILFESLGAQVATATDGQGALAAARSLPPDAFVSDVLMSGLDDFDLAAEVRKDTRLGSVPVVLVTSHPVESSDRELARRVGANRLVFRTPGLQEAVDALLESLAETAPPLTESPSPRTSRCTRLERRLQEQVQANKELTRQRAIQEAEIAMLRRIHEDSSGGGCSSTTPALGELLASCLDAAGISRGALYLRDERGELAFEQAVGYPDEGAGGPGAFFGQRDFLQAAATAAGPVAIPSPDCDGATVAALLAAAGVSSALVVPLFWAKNQLGVLFLGSSTTDVTGPDSVSFAATLGAKIGQTLALVSAVSHLARSEERYRRIVETAAEGIWMVDADGRTTFANQRMAEILGETPESMQGRGLMDWRWPEDQEVTRELFARRHHGVSERIDVKLRRHDGGTVFVEMSATPIMQNGEMAGALALFSDVTELRKAQAQIMTSDRMASIGLLAAGVGHEINNPLTGVIGYLQLAQMKAAHLACAHDSIPGDAADLQADLREALAAAWQVSRIVKDLKIFSRHREQAVTAVDVHDVLESTVRMAWNEIRHRSRLVREYGEIPPVLGNESRLGQVFLNLIMNAVQAIPDGKAHANEIRILTGTAPDGRVVIEIADTGSGIPPEILGRLFTPFVTTKPVGIGTGIGLSICHRIVTDLGGEITAESKPGEGARFRVILPAAAKAAPEPPVAAETTPAGRRGRVLVIDDEEMICGLIRTILADEHEVSVTAHAVEALQWIASGERFDLILCDAMMPVMSGAEFLSGLGISAPDLVDRVVLMTGGTFTRPTRELVARHPGGYLEKPFEATRLLQIVSSRVGGQRCSLPA